MLISVIITTYNSPDFLKKCLNSFLKQKGQVFSSNFAFYGDMSARVMNILEGFVILQGRQYQYELVYLFQIF